VIGILIAVALVLGGVNSWAASTAVPTISPDGRFIEWLCTSHTDGTVSGSGVQSVAVNGVITQMEVVPGAITPDATLDVDLNQLVNGITEDLTGSIFDNCSAAGNTRYWADRPRAEIDNTWKHWAISLPGAAQSDIESSELHINGELQTVASTVTTKPQGTRNAFIIGGSMSYPYRGGLLFFTAINRVLSRAEILSHYNLTRPFIGV